jgi:hypothetical protein
MLRTAVALGITAVATAVSFQQNVRDIVLRPADATLDEPFTRIHSIRELANRRVLITDNSSETRLVVADLRTGSVRALGHQGSGPGEYRQATGLLALSHDSTLLVDGYQSHRWLLLVNDSIVKTLPPDYPAISAVPGDVFGVDSSGNVLGLRPGVVAQQLSGEFSRTRHLAVLASRRSGRIDTLFETRGYDQRVRFNRSRTFSAHTVLLGSTDEQVQLFPDGWIAIVRVEPYRVDWRSPNGTIRRGPDLAWEAPRSDETEKRAFAERYRRQNRTAPDFPWAERLAPIRPGSHGTPEGNILVARSQWSRVTDTRYDLVDRGGRLISRLALPDSERVVGFGPRNVYVAVTDADGFQFLRRHPWP